MSKKRAPNIRQTAAEPKKARRRAASSDEQSPRGSNKTPQVMRLLEQNKGSANPVILAGKSRIPSRLAGREPLSRILRRDLGEEFADFDGIGGSSESIVVNLTQLALEHEAPLILDRFNACSCDKCVEVISSAVAKRVPVRFARVKKTSRHGGSELTERMEPVRKMVLTEMIRELIGNKKRCFHD